jgi:hypothetical protein
MHISKKMILSFACAFVLSLSLTASAEAQSPPQPPCPGIGCTPSALTIVISYKGLSSGCDSSLTNGPLCEVGELIEYGIVTCVSAQCALELSWAFPDGTISGPTTVVHRLINGPSPYVVTLTAVSIINTVTVTANIPVAKASEVTALGPLAMIAFVMCVTYVALRRMA